MPTLTKDDVVRVAALSKIAVTNEEAERLVGELDTILGYVRQLDQLNLEQVDPTYQVTGLVNVLRDDTLPPTEDETVSQKALLQNAAQVQDNQIKVPKVL